MGFRTTRTNKSNLLNIKMKKILLILTMAILLVTLVNAQECNVGETSDGLYCSVDGTWETQITTGACQNNFECESEICQGNICQDYDLTSLLITGVSDLEDLANQAADSGAAATSNGGGGGSGSWRGAGGICLSNWTCTKYSPCISGKQTRTCSDINDCEPPYYGKPAEEILCSILRTPTCSDGIKNQQEEGVDCGGPCEVCKTCFDNIENCHDAQCEDGVDCGGPCMPCKRAITAMLIIITTIIVIILIILGIWYWRIRKTTEDVEIFPEQPGKSFRL